MTRARHVTWAEIRLRAASLRETIVRDVLRYRPTTSAGMMRDPAPTPKVFGVPRGGCAVAALVGQPVDRPEDADAIVDDLIDSGATRDRWSAKTNKPFFALYDKRAMTGIKPWLTFPWEDNEPPAGDAVVRLLEMIGEDPKREGLIDTPRRVTKALQEMTSGRDADVAKILSTTFEAKCDEMVCVKGIEFWSLCEHHLLPFHGHATVAYIPNEDGRVVGLSKIPRVVLAYARRLQLQEQLTQQIAHALNDALEPRGVAVSIEATHTCMEARGVERRGAMATQALLGAFRDAEVRAEFTALASR